MLAGSAGGAGRWQGVDRAARWVPKLVVCSGASSWGFSSLRLCLRAGPAARAGLECLGAPPAAQGDGRR